MRTCNHCHQPMPCDNDCAELAYIRRQQTRADMEDDPEVLKMTDRMFELGENPWDDDAMGYDPDGDDMDDPD